MGQITRIKKKDNFWIKVLLNSVFEYFGARDALHGSSIQNFQPTDTNPACVGISDQISDSFDWIQL